MRQRWKSVLSSAVSGLLLIVGALLIWGTLIEPRLILDEERERVAIPELPPAWEGRAIGIISDLQIGMWGDNPAMAMRAVERLLEERPAAVLLAGDFVYLASSDLRADLSLLGEILAPLSRSGIPTYAVLGNHDYGVSKKGDPRKEHVVAGVIALLNELRIELLHNESIPLPGPGPSESSLFLVGIGPHRPGEDRPDLAFAPVPEGAPRIVLMHNPNTFGALRAGTAPLAIAGHTHGGQVRMPFAPEWSYLTFARDDEVHVDGWIDDYGAAGNALYVNRGIGFSILPLRLNCPPEVTFIHLTAAR